MRWRKDEGGTVNDVRRFRRYQRPALRHGELTIVGLSAVAASRRVQALDVEVPMVTVRDPSVITPTIQVMSTVHKRARLLHKLEAIAHLDVGRASAGPEKERQVNGPACAWQEAWWWTLCPRDAHRGCTGRITRKRVEMRSNC